MVASASGVIDSAGKEIPASVIEPGGLGPSDRIFGSREALRFLASGNLLRCSAVSIRVAAHADVGGFDPEYRYVVDWDFWVRLARRWSLAWLATPTVDVRWHAASETHRFKTGIADLEETERLLANLRADLELDAVSTAELISVGRRRLSRAYLNRAHEALRGGNGSLGRDCLLRSLRIWPGLFWVIVSDPRLASQMAAVWAAPGPSGRWFGQTVGSD